MNNAPSPVWFSPEETYQYEIDEVTYSWLIEQGSLTQRLQKAHPNQFSVQLLTMRWEPPDFSEARLLTLPLGQKALIRQVYLRGEDGPYIFAHSVVPAVTLEKHQPLQHLGNRSMGDYLFAFSQLRRVRVEWAQLLPKHSLYQMAMGQQRNKAEVLWGRRSLFAIDDNMLLVSEFFLPNLCG